MLSGLAVLLARPTRAPLGTRPRFARSAFGRRLALLLCLASSAAGAASHEFFVSSTGSDTNAGTRSKPFATLEAARDAVRKLKQAGMLPKGGVTVWLRDGDHVRTQALELTGEEKVLEIGTGSGYQAAILAELAGSVITVERLPALAESAKKVLDGLGYTNIETHLAEATLGWPKLAPYDAIMVTAGAPEVPKDLLTQLATGGRMVIPVGSRYVQELCRVTKHRNRNVIENLGGCRFVSLIGKGAWED